MSGVNGVEKYGDRESCVSGRKYPHINCDHFREYVKTRAHSCFVADNDDKMCSARSMRFFSRCHVGFFVVVYNVFVN